MHTAGMTNPMKFQVKREQLNRTSNKVSASRRTEGIMLKKQKSGWKIDDPTCRGKQDDATASVICVTVVILLIFFLTFVWLYWRS
jgi:hypothetical protein